MYLTPLDENVEEIKTNFKNKPYFVFLSLTNACNANCVFCDVRTNKEILCDIDVYKLIDELAEMGTKYIHFTGGGEPLTDKNIFDYMKYASKKGINIVFISNGYLLNEQNISNLEGINLKVAFLSLDSAKPCIHNKLRRTNELFEKATSAINLLKKKFPDIKINLNHVLNKDNIDEFENFIKLKDLYNFDFLNPILIKDCIELTPTQEQIRSFKEKKDYYLQLLKEKKLKLLCDSLNLFESNIDERGNRSQNDDMRCSFANFCAFVDAPSGKVYPCDCSIHRDRKLYCLGDLHNDNFKDIWNGEKRKNLINQLNRGELSCKTMCDEANCLFNKKFYER